MFTAKVLNRAELASKQHGRNHDMIVAPIYTNYQICWFFSIVIIWQKHLSKLESLVTLWLSWLNLDVLQLTKGTNCHKLGVLQYFLICSKIILTNVRIKFLCPVSEFLPFSISDKCNPLLGVGLELGCVSFSFRCISFNLFLYEANSDLYKCSLWSVDLNFGF